MNIEAVNKYERTDLVIVKKNGKDVEAEVLDVKREGGKYVYTLDGIDSPVTEMEIRRSASCDDSFVASELVKIAKELHGAWSVSKPGEVLMLRDFPMHVRREILKVVDGMLSGESDDENREAKEGANLIVRRNPEVVLEDVLNMIFDIYYARQEREERYGSDDKVAKELVKIAKELAASGWDRFSGDLVDVLEAQLMINKNKNDHEIFQIIKRNSDIVEMMKEEGMTDRDLKNLIGDMYAQYMMGRIKPASSSEIKAMDFPTQDAFDKYMKDHPDADRSNHRVVETKKEVSKPVEKEKSNIPSHKPSDPHSVKSIGGQSPQEYAGQWGNTKSQGGAHFYNYSSDKQEKDDKFYDEFINGKGGIRDTMKEVSDSLNKGDKSYTKKDLDDLQKLEWHVEAERKSLKSKKSSDESTMEKEASSSLTNKEVGMSRERMTSRTAKSDEVMGALATLRKALTAADDAELTQWADELAKEEKAIVKVSTPEADVKDEGDQNAKANANWPLTEQERMTVASTLVKLAKELTK